MRRGKVYLRGDYAGEVVEVSPSEYLFRYDDAYFFDSSKQAISLTLDKSRQEYHSEYLFPFFFNMLSEGSNRQAQSRLLHIDENDHFGILLATAQTDVVGAVTVKPIEQ